MPIYFHNVFRPMEIKIICKTLTIVLPDLLNIFRRLAAAWAYTVSLLP